MSKLRILMLLVIFLSGIPSAYAVFVPEWRGLEGTTYQQWRFDDDDNPAVPEVIDNDYGSASASITIGLMGTPEWMNDPGLGTQTGIWDIGGDDGSIVLDIDNRPLALDYKEIWVQVTYYESIGGAPDVGVVGAQFVSSQTALIEEDGALGAWYLEKSIWRIEPNPSHEQVILTGNPYGSVIDQIVVDTYCIPEPASMALLALGGLTILRKRQQQA